MSHLWHNAWLMHCSEWCMRYFLCSLSVMKSHLTIFLLWRPRDHCLDTVHVFPPAANNSPKHAVQGSPFRSTLGVGYNKEIFFHFKVRHTALLVKWCPSVFSGVFRLALSSWEVFPSRRYGCKTFPEVCAFDSTVRDVFLLCRGFWDKVIQSQAVTLFPRPCLWV